MSTSFWRYVSSIGATECCASNRQPNGYVGSGASGSPESTAAAGVRIHPNNLANYLKRFLYSNPT
ncbi:hypothetical protein P171DRAFT_430501 [Karstenula rhodostoma CBS 690.94]|uniref:Uncharacterized protein n=1 Tax=Karstenula rhodostoma CBS 690.94 TaxID=1392251 RepID=A0A9P4PJQ0_9PLEO|nr:hypothetical protein P171DRAFT_430501 [Karstenula rhodostoma CBS 690.94]